MARLQKVLFTGGTGFIGRNVLPILSRHAEVTAPSRAELNLLDEAAVSRYVREGGFDVVVHAANSTPAKNPLDSADRLLADGLRAYFNLRRESSYFGRMYYLGSGAEFDKREPIASVTEDAFGIRVPADDYGFSKYVMNGDARRSENVVNLRIFGCYGPTDAKSKFIRDAIDCCLAGGAVTVRQDCMFDYMYVEDLARVLLVLMAAPVTHHDYNICSGRRISLREIAEEVRRQMGNALPVQVAAPGMNREYTASNARFMSEHPDFSFTPLTEGIARQIVWQRDLD